MNNCEDPSSKPRTVHLRIASKKKQKTKQKKRSQSRFIVLHPQETRGIRLDFKPRFSHECVVVESVLQAGFAL